MFARIAALPLAQTHRLAPLMLIAVGMALLGIEGFGGGTMLHEFVHDSRHVFAFPCH